jgi:hypothetical protein
MAIINQQPDLLFDKIINVSFKTDYNISLDATTNGGSNSSVNLQSTDDIICPLTGRKPQISIEGSLLPNGNVMLVTLKITNFYTSKPLSSYKTVIIEAGYKNSISVAFQGQIYTAYVSKPPPDSETLFMFFVGNASDYFSKTVQGNFYAGQDTIGNILARIASSMNSNAKVTYLPNSFETTVRNMQLVADIPLNCTINEAIRKLRKQFGVNSPSKQKIEFYLEGNTITVYDPSNGTEITHLLTYIKSAKREASLFTIVAPWIPTIRPGDKIQADHAYFKQKISPSGNNGNWIDYNFYKVQQVSFNFDTCGDQNEMTIICQGVP